MRKPKYCPTCGYDQIFRQVEIHGVLYDECTFCNARRPEHADEAKRFNLGSLIVILMVGVTLSACQRKDDKPQPTNPHVAGSWVGTGTDDAIGYYIIGMDLTQDGGTAAGTFTMTGNVATVTGNVYASFNGPNLQGLRLTRVQWTVNDPANAGRLCAVDLTARSDSRMTGGSTAFHYTMSDCQGGTWEGGANLTKQAGTN